MKVAITTPSKKVQVAIALKTIIFKSEVNFSATNLANYEIVCSKFWKVATSDKITYLDMLYHLFILLQDVNLKQAI